MTTKLIESELVIKRTSDGGTITVLRLSPEAKQGLTTGGAKISLPPDRSAKNKP